MGLAAQDVAALPPLCPHPSTRRCLQPHSVVPNTAVRALVAAQQWQAQAVPLPAPRKGRGDKGQVQVPPPPHPAAASSRLGPLRSTGAGAGICQQVPHDDVMMSSPTAHEVGHMWERCGPCGGSYAGEVWALRRVISGRGVGLEVGHMLDGCGP